MSDSGVQTVTPGSLTGGIANDKLATFSKLNSKNIRASSLLFEKQFSCSYMNSCYSGCRSNTTAALRGTLTFGLMSWKN